MGLWASMRRVIWLGDMCSDLRRLLVKDDGKRANGGLLLAGRRQSHVGIYVVGCSLG